jgi:hypothetical protein
MKKTTITCDHCGYDLSVASRAHEFRIVLSSEKLARRHFEGMTELDVVPPDPPVVEPRHFCDWKCLRNWLGKKGQ